QGESRTRRLQIESDRGRFAHRLSRASIADFDVESKRLEGQCATLAQRDRSQQELLRARSLILALRSTARSDAELDQLQVQKESGVGKSQRSRLEDRIQLCRNHRSFHDALQSEE